MEAPHGLLQLLKRNLFRLLLGLLTLLYISPAYDYLRVHLLDQESEPSYYVDSVGCITSQTSTAAKYDLEDCRLINIRIPKTAGHLLTEVQISGVDQDVPLVASNAKGVTFVAEKMPGFRYVTLKTNTVVPTDTPLLLSLYGPFQQNCHVGLVIDGKMVDPDGTTIADGHVLYLTRHWRTILLLMVSGFLLVNHREQVLERLRS